MLTVASNDDAAVRKGVGERLPLGQVLALVVEALIALFIGLMWWCLPLTHGRHTR
jgi:hypothetical protein